MCFPPEGVPPSIDPQGRLLVQASTQTPHGSVIPAWNIPSS